MVKNKQPKPYDGPSTPAQVLGQTKWWIPKEGGPIKIKNMENAHRLYTLAFLERNAAGIQLRELNSLYLSMAFAGPGALDGVSDALDAYMAELRDDPLEWIHNRPVYGALLRAAIADVTSNPDFPPTEEKVAEILNSSRDIYMHVSAGEVAGLGREIVALTPEILRGS